MQEILLKIGYFERGLSKSLKKIKFFFLLNPVSFNGKYCEKEKGLGNSDQSLCRLQNMSRKIILLVMHYLTNQVY